MHNTKRFLMVFGLLLIMGVLVTTCSGVLASFWIMATKGAFQLSSVQARLNVICNNLQKQQKTQDGIAALERKSSLQGQEIRINFAKGAISWQGTVSEQFSRYVFYAVRGQSVEILLTQGDRPANAVLILTGSDGKVLQHAKVNRPDWRGVLPKTQDYHINILNSTTGMQLTVTVFPLPQDPRQVQDTGVGYRMVYDGKYFYIKKPGYFQNEIFGLGLTCKKIFMNTNLAEAYYIMALEPINDPKTCLNTSPADLIAGLVDNWRVNGIDYQHYRTAEGAAGNFYDSDVFRTYIHRRCITVYLFIHTHNLANYNPGTVAAYNRKEVMAELKRVFYTLVWP